MFDEVLRDEMRKTGVQKEPGHKEAGDFREAHLPRQFPAGKSDGDSNTDDQNP
jgi:hypothetical protein